MNEIANLKLSLQKMETARQERNEQKVKALIDKFNSSYAHILSRIYRLAKYAELLQSVYDKGKTGERIVRQWFIKMSMTSCNHITSARHFLFPDTEKDVVFVIGEIGSNNMLFYVSKQNVQTITTIKADCINDVNGDTLEEGCQICDDLNLLLDRTFNSLSKLQGLIDEQTQKFIDEKKQYQ